MLGRKRYIFLSLELHLFYARIMKEHAIFLEAGFTPKNTKLAKEADEYKLQLEKLLLDTIKISNGRVRQEVLDSGELYTDYTLSTERKTEYYTGIEINSKITIMETKLQPKGDKEHDKKIMDSVKKLNCRAIKLLDGLIDLKTKVLNEVLSCNLFTASYPTFLDHLIHEAKLYRSYVYSLENDQDIEEKNIKDAELFWDHIMLEHASFIRGLLDPSEGTLIRTADEFIKKYNDLIQKTINMDNIAMLSVTDNTLTETINFRDFKKSGTEGIDECKIKSMMLPLMADHVLREANHYIRLLKSFENRI
ncbi:DUF2935 domain-containing protein [Clostridium sp. DSM 100503]|uniref:DUF2935 domain-containing protein n=1 Tax=Clostridium sp. DSM 100503 TaxID=2963282 RepID=UPI002149CB80|nr:DUF2935 domain-containing protein [Clostridium sp. DSM 100503]MCR1951640.1 DUF2935 domain-containing protein [Clostridium sp. DSM 100503]